MLDTSLISVLVPNSTKDNVEKVLAGTINGVTVNQHLRCEGPGIIVFDTVANTFFYIHLTLPPNCVVTSL